jgi:hypothetical protein
MGTGVATQLITVGATLSGVVLTLVTNAFLESRRAREVRDLESMRLASEHARWLRDERLKAYAALSMVGEEVLQFIRSELPPLIEPNSDGLRDETEARWRELRTELRKAYNQVALFGDDPPRTAGQQIWRTARNGANDFLRGLANRADAAGTRSELAEQIRAAEAELGIAGELFLEVCRKDLQGD